MRIKALTTKQITARLSQEMDRIRVPRLHLYRGVTNPLSLSEPDLTQRIMVKSSKCAFDILKPYYCECMNGWEEVNCLLMNRSRGCIGVVNISKGGTQGTFVDSKIIFGAALMAGASHIVMSHNHPSGVLRPSKQDIEVTQKINTGASCIDVMLDDHIIITENGYFSFRDNGLIIND